MSTPAQGCSGPLPAYLATAGTDGEVSLYKERSVLGRFHGQRATGSLQSGSIFPNSTAVLKAGLYVAVVAKGLPARLTAAAQSSPEFHTRHILGGPFNVKVPVYEERSIRGDL